ncbi:phospholipase A, partial [Rhizorhapis sp. SPR117]|uniref:phospholipase A n=1 Tax=Rhizorhapis sp. SPR117 TaxID=2912611 RepID=UPI001F00D9F3|nr:phospholipase A [Rhizorhapis sp. SPR117]
MTARSLSWFMAGASILLASAAHATSPVEILIGDAGQIDQDGAILVDLRLLNGDRDPQTLSLPDRIEARIGASGSVRTVWLERAANIPASLTVPPGGFMRARYRLPAPSDLARDGMTLSIPAWSSQKITLALRPATQEARAMSTSQPPPEPKRETAPSPADRSAGNAFLANLSAYEPIYAVYGPGTNSEARIQFSFKYQLFGSRRAEGLPRSWRDGLHFAYTQRMFWDLGGDSSPFRNVDYQPELFYLTPSATLSNGISVSAQGGIRHESNGRDGAASRSINSLYVAPMAAIPLGGGYRLSVAPRLALFVGDKSDNPDIRRYRGITGLFV